MTRTIHDLNNQLFDQLERLNSDIDGEELETEINRAKAMTGIGTVIVKNNKVAFDAIKLLTSGRAHTAQVETLLGSDKKISHEI